MELAPLPMPFWWQQSWRGRSSTRSRALRAQYLRAPTRLDEARLRGLSTWLPRRRRDSSPRTIHVATAASPRFVGAISRAANAPRGRVLLAGPREAPARPAVGHVLGQRDAVVGLFQVPEEAGRALVVDAVDLRGTRPLVVGPDSERSR